MNEKILIVDDEQDILKMLSKLLLEERFQVKTALGGEEAIELFKSEPFDAVITDMRMPGMDGLAVIKRLKEIDENIEVIILTGFAALDNVIQAFRNNGAFDYLTKPLDNINDLFITINRAIESRRLKIENKVLLQKLKQAKDDLEKRVEARTRELSEANQKLQRELAQRKKTEAALKKSKEAAEAASLSKSMFLANMSHELRTPLNHIIGFTELVVDNTLGELNEAQTTYLKDAVLSSRHLLSLINDILDLSKVETGRLELNPTVVDIKLFLENCLIMIRKNALKQGLEVKNEFDQLPETMTIDEGKLKQILHNLLSNAVKFTPGGGNICVNARRVELDAGLNVQQMDTDVLKQLLGCVDRSDNSGKKTEPYIEFAVSESGIGIKPEDQQRIFERFEQVDESLEKKYQGTGLGLSLTKALVELHGGKIWAESAGDNKGSTFYCILPESFENLY